MSNKDRVFATLEGARVNQRPFTAMLSLYGARLTNCPLRHYYTDPQAYAQGQTAILETFHPDILFSPFLCAGEGAAFGAKLKFFDNQPPNMLHPVIRSPEEIPRLSLPDIDVHATLVYVRKALSEIAAAHGSEVAIASTLLSPVDLPLMIMGIECWMQTVLFDKDGVRRMLDLTIPFFDEYANALFRDGADVLMIPVSFLSPVIVTREIIENLTLPVLRDVFANLQGPIIIHHAGGPFLKFLNLCVGLPNVIGFVVGHQDNLSQARRIVGRGVTLLGGLDGPNLGKTSPEEVEALCRGLLEDRSTDPHFILATSGPDVAFDTPPENISAIRRAVQIFSEGNDA
ncbi:MAG: uroporphyrinogen decarboxylase [candidate division Zixibacteria bacterium]|nr:uroporphyrinogen decarboxylase [candidate division Zixibacteria bacterium]